jgi:hypothetical protein
MNVTNQELDELNKKLATGMTLKAIAIERGEDYPTFYQRLRIAGVKLSKQLVWRQNAEGSDATA